MAPCMSSSLKSTVLAVISLFLVAAIAAPAAQAVTHEIVFPGGQKTGVLTGQNERLIEDEFTIQTLLGTQVVKCPVSSYQGTVANGAKEATLHPAEEGQCKLGETPVPTNTNDCAFVFKSGETESEGYAPMTVECENEGKESESRIEIDIPNLCKLTIGAQHKLKKGVHYMNVSGTSPHHITARVTAEGMEIVGKDPPSEGLNNCGMITGSTTYHSAQTIKAYEDFGNTGTAMTPNFIEGAQIAVEVKPGA
jgi:hypothetical protein